jgi:hypothetical protein
VESGFEEAWWGESAGLGEKIVKQPSVGNRGISMNLQGEVVDQVYVPASFHRSHKLIRSLGFACQGTARCLVFTNECSIAKASPHYEPSSPADIHTPPFTYRLTPSNVFTEHD